MLGVTAGLGGGGARAPVPPPPAESAPEIEWVRFLWRNRTLGLHVYIQLRYWDFI